MESENEPFDLGESVKIFSIGVIVAFVIAAAVVGGWVMTHPTVDNAEEEYYRALYDLCRATGRPVEVCMMDLAYFTSEDWYGQPSEGWKWTP